MHCKSANKNSFMRAKSGFFRWIILQNKATFNVKTEETDLLKVWLAHNVKTAKAIFSNVLVIHNVKTEEWFWKEKSWAFWNV